MATGQQSKAPQSHRVGEHWSGANPIPTISHFMEHIDAEKKERDRRIDEENRAKKERTTQSNQGKLGKGIKKRRCRRS
ncbi:hypothetical protein N7519_004218 [Penicillium mononematosum]|uniref:uncharacterized protein n=1 Tax=Penicillium mononematosum TaxID=268346 RepID=UPI0025470C67|nr:uncharacterized protein N7519_004218 [Penicillium mononematosum]KAJ6189310.1 hypothetical protein N7519_004218 [Penicillium mononematosum]